MNNRPLARKYKKTALVYDLLDYPWERRYRHWRANILGDLNGRILEAGIGTGHNLKYYHDSIEVIGIDLSIAMLRRARRRGHKYATCQWQLLQMDACQLGAFKDASFDGLVSTFLCCVMPDEYQLQAINEFARVLKPGAPFKLLEIIYSKDPKRAKWQRLIAPWVEKVYGARFDRQTRHYLANHPKLSLNHQRYLKDDTYLLLEGHRR